MRGAGEIAEDLGDELDDEAGEQDDGVGRVALRGARATPGLCRAWGVMREHDRCEGVAARPHLVFAWPVIARNQAVRQLSIRIKGVAGPAELPSLRAHGGRLRQQAGSEDSARPAK